MVGTCDRAIGWPGEWAVGNGAGGVIVVSNVFLWFARARDESNFSLSPSLSFGHLAWLSVQASHSPLLTKMFQTPHSPLLTKMFPGVSGN